MPVGVTRSIVTGEAGDRYGRTIFRRDAMIRRLPHHRLECSAHCNDRNCDQKPEKGEASGHVTSLPETLVESLDRDQHATTGICTSVYESLSLSGYPTDGLDQFLDLRPLVGDVPRRKRAGHTMENVVAQDFLLGPLQGGPDRRDLRDNIDAVAIAPDHSRDPANLSRNPVEPLQNGRLCWLAHSD